MQHEDAHPAQRLSPKLVPAVDRAVAVLTAVVQAKRPMPLGEISRTLQLPKSTTHGLCQTLVCRGYLRKLDSGFVIGRAVMPLASAYLELTSIPGEFNLLWSELDPPPKEVVVLSIQADGDVLYAAARNVARLPTLLFTEGLQIPAHLCASGKAMLAWKPETELLEMFAGKPIVRRTSNGPSTLEQLFADLRIVRASGYSIDQGCVHEDLVSFGAPVFDSSASPVAGIGLVFRKDAVLYAPDVYPRKVMDLAARLTRRLHGRIPDAA